MKLKATDTVLLTRRLSDLMAGGLPLTQCMDVLRRQSSNPYVRVLLFSIQNELEAGRSFSQALRIQKGQFSEIYMGMVQSGESSGNLDAALSELVKLLETELDTRQRIRSAFAYPVFLLAMAVAVCMFIVGFVIPRFDFLFQDLGQQLPLPTRLLIGFSSIIRFTAIPLVLLTAAFLLSFRKRKTPWLRVLQNKALEISVLRDLWRGAIIQRWASMMAALLHSGYAVSEALRLAGQSIGNPLFKLDSKLAVWRIMEGQSVKQALGGLPWFSPMVCELIGASEESGRLEETFERIAESSKRENELQWKIFLSVLEPSLILGMGLVVGFVALAMLLPIFEMSGSLK